MNHGTFRHFVARAFLSRSPNTSATRRLGRDDYSATCQQPIYETFIAWFASERTLSIHAIFTTKREAFYWLAILFTFALGTAAGDLVAEHFALGYMATGILFAMIIGSITAGYYMLKLDGICAFWIAYIFTRPLGASFGDLLSQPTEYGGLGFGTIITSAMFLTAIVAIVIYMSATREGEEIVPTV
jgi:uncharacterized membrane-anchored protein